MMDFHAEKNLQHTHLHTHPTDVFMRQPVYSWPGSAVHGELLYTSHRPCHLTPSPLYQTPSTCHSALLALHLRPLGVLGLPQQPGIHCQMVCGIQHRASTASGNSRRWHFFWPVAHYWNWYWQVLEKSLNVNWILISGHVFQLTI